MLAFEHILSVVDCIRDEDGQLGIQTFQGSSVPIACIFGSLTSMVLLRVRWVATAM